MRGDVDAGEEIRMQQAMDIMMTMRVLLILSLGSVVVGMNDEVNVTVTISSGRYALQDYLCSGQLKSNMAIVLDNGEHRIRPGLSCNIFNESNITIIGSSMRNTTIRCEEQQCKKWFWWCCRNSDIISPS